MDKLGLYISRCSLALSLAVKMGLGAWLVLALMGGPTGSVALTSAPAPEAVKAESAVEPVRVVRRKRRVRRAREGEPPQEETASAQQPKVAKDAAQPDAKDIPVPGKAEAAKSSDSAKATPAAKDEPADKGTGHEPVAGEAPKEMVWSDAEIIEALQECLRLLAPIAANLDVSKPMRNGQCGTPAPVIVKRVGSVEISPPATLNCRMVASLHDWVETKLQPAARDVFNAPVTRMINASGYVCRHRYGSRDDSKISEHAFANALDISSFVTANGRTLDVLRHWGPTGRDLREVAAARVEAENLTHAALAAEKAATAAEQAAEKAAKAAEKAAKSKSKAKAKETKAAAAKEAREAADAARRDAEAAEERVKAEQAKVDARFTGARRTGDAAEKKKADDRPVPESRDLPLPPKKTSEPRERRVTAANERSNLGVQPRTAVDTHAGSNDADLPAEAMLLRRLHQGACGIFGTVLGPEANEAHRNHFHFDLAARKRRAFCE